MAGKGGVGKTTLGATIGLSAARSGLDTILVELDGHSSLGRPFGHEQLSYDDLDLLRGDDSVRGSLRGRQVTPDDALVEYLAASGLDQIGGRLLRNGAVDVVSTAAPGIRDLLALGKIRQLETSGAADLIVVDAPAAGHALTFLRAASGLRSSSTSGPVREQAEAVLEMFADERRCQVVMVTLPEETPINELVETAYDIEDEVGLKLGPVVVNSVWPEIEGLAEELQELGRQTSRASKSRVSRSRQLAASYRLDRCAAQQAQCHRLAEELALPQAHLPFLFRQTIDREALGELSDALVRELERLEL